jgi:hypothetical protein
MKTFARALMLFAALTMSMPNLASAQTITPVAYDALYLYNVDEGAEQFCVLKTPFNQPIPVSSRIQAAASLTVTAVSGSPFLNVEVGDQLLVTNSDGTPYRLAVSTRASATSITVVGINSSTGAMLSTLTLTNALFSYREIECGTTPNAGVIDISRVGAKVLLPYISQSSLNSGNLQIRVLCRTQSGVPWVQVAPAVTPPSVTATYYGYATTVLGLFAADSIAGYGQCRVGFSLSGTDTGAVDLVSISVSGYTE